ncbi:MAG: hypothetical protein ING19_17540, partial [Azospirillum sp.]|nr:hypothetical protein [Azospirillum sp.]
MPSFIISGTTETEMETKVTKKIWTEKDLSFAELDVVKGDVRVTLEWIGEGNDGDFQLDDPDDTPLIRFSVYRRNVDGKNTGNEFEPVDEASYCTRIPIDTDRATLRKVADRIMDEVYDRVRDGVSI